MCECGRVGHPVRSWRAAGIALEPLGGASAAPTRGNRGRLAGPSPPGLQANQTHAFSPRPSRAPAGAAVKGDLSPYYKRTRPRVGAPLGAPCSHPASELRTPLCGTTASGKAALTPRATLVTLPPRCDSHCHTHSGGVPPGPSHETSVRGSRRHRCPLHVLETQLLGTSKNSPSGELQCGIGVTRTHILHRILTFCTKGYSKRFVESATRLKNRLEVNGWKERGPSRLRPAPAGGSPEAPGLRPPVPSARTRGLGRSPRRPLPTTRELRREGRRVRLPPPRDANGLLSATAPPRSPHPQPRTAGKLPSSAQRSPGGAGRWLGGRGPERSGSRPAQEAPEPAGAADGLGVCAPAWGALGCVALPPLVGLPCVEFAVASPAVRAVPAVPHYPRDRAGAGFWKAAQLPTFPAAGLGSGPRGDRAGGGRRAFWKSVSSRESATPAPRERALEKRLCPLNVTRTTEKAFPGLFVWFCSECSSPRET